MSAPILIDCEGAGCPTHRKIGHRLLAASEAGHHGICAMCGRIVEVDVVGKAVDHQREDIVAMLARGDFGDGLTDGLDREF